MVMETKECKRCKHKFKVEALTDGLCALCAGQSPQAEDVNKGRVVSSETVREDDVVRIIHESVPTREQIEVMVRMIVKEEMAAMNSIVGSLGPTSVVATAGRLKSIPKTLKTKNCIKCEQPFTPRSGNQKKCDNCRKGTI